MLSFQSAQTSPPKRVVLLNDTSDQQNWGSQALTESVRDIITTRFPGAEVSGIPSWVLMKAKLPDGGLIMRSPAMADEFELYGIRWNRGEGGPWAEEFLKLAREADLVIYNGEGSIYRNNPSAKRALFMCWYAKTELGVPIVYLNGGLHLTEVEAYVPMFAKRVFPLFSHVALREPKSLRSSQEYLPEVAVELVPDSVYSFASSGQAKRWVDEPKPLPFNLEGDYFCVSAGMMKFSLLAGVYSPLPKLILRLKKLVPNCIVMAKDPDDQYIQQVAELTDSTFMGSEYHHSDVVRVLAGAKFQLTGRYHLLIMAAIVGTPTIGFESLSHKVQGTAEFFGDLLPKPYNMSYLLGANDDIHSRVKIFLKQGEGLREKLRARSVELGKQTTRFGEIIEENLSRPRTQEKAPV